MTVAGCCSKGDANANFLRSTVCSCVHAENVSLLLNSVLKSRKASVTQRESHAPGFRLLS
jgi:hypothetical protein